jgi:hypothetical protein
LADDIVITAVTHGRRHPRRWQTAHSSCLLQLELQARNAHVVFFATAALGDMQPGDVG